jgi:gamma-D-glutamyl-L-lysine dipeptidyl-peptidase
MAYMMVLVAVAPLRAEAAHRSEMVSSLLFGELVELMDQSGDFYQVKCLYDQYEGWCQKTQLLAISNDLVANQSNDLAAEFANLLEVNGTDMQIPIGASLGLFSHKKLTIGKFEFTYKGVVAKPNPILFAPDYIKHIAMQYLHAPYLWGGRSVFGIDCSGFTQQVFRFFAKHLPRDAYQQAVLGEVVGFLQEAQCGDLAFFDNAEGRITHVGMMLDAQTIVHASGRVRIDSIDNMGIISSDTGERTHQLRILKRY